MLSKHWDSTSFLSSMSTRCVPIGSISFPSIDSSHQTTEITRLQIGEDPDEVRLMVKTLSEAENLLPLLLEYLKQGKQVSVSKGRPKVSLEILIAASSCCMASHFRRHKSKELQISLESSVEGEVMFVFSSSTFGSWN
jgi:hypothetical protein